MIGNLYISLVMPCRNEEAHLGNPIKSVPDFFDEIILVENRSTDDTYRVAKSLENRMPKLRVLKDDRTHGGIGYGYAHITGIGAATGDIIVCADCDGTYPIEDVPRLLRSMLEQGCAFATCSRYPDSSITLMHRLGVTTLNLEILVLYGLKLCDSLSGMWIFLKDVIPRLKLTEGDWNLSPQIKINAHKHCGELFCELPVRQARGRLGQTKQSYWRTGIRHAMWIACNRVHERQGLLPTD